MSATEIAKKMIQRHEGLRLKPYRCTAGKLTIGYGRNLEDRGISLEEAEFLFKEDLRLVEGQLRRHVGFYSELPTEAQAVLLDMAFNVGISRLLGFKMMLEALKTRNYAKAAEEMADSLWAKQVPTRAQELQGMIRKLDPATQT